MKKVITKEWNPWTRKYSLFKNGIETIEDLESLEQFKQVVLNLENSQSFLQDDGRVLDSNGNEIFDPNYPDEFDYIDYAYRIKEEE